MSKTIALKPRLNEKTYGLADDRVYVFDVERSVNKHGIARAVEAQFDVKVVKVKTANIPGKSKRTISLTGKRVKYGADGSRSDFKKAYVTLAEGQGLPFFEAIEEEEQKEQKAQEQFDKAAAKQADKDEKAAKKTAKKSDKPSAAKTDTKSKPAAKAAKPAAKPADKAGAKEAESEEEPEKKRGLKAWRGFRRRKKDGGNK
jgi:large subunit ribosomal protein L23